MMDLLLVFPKSDGRLAEPLKSGIPNSVVCGILLAQKPGILWSGLLKTTPTEAPDFETGQEPLRLSVNFERNF
jgi:hypothetical protein